jgi:hypothetical protein
MATIKRSNWRVDYELSRASGLRLGVCTYMGQPVVHAASVPFVYVGYVAHRPGHFTDKLKSNQNKVEVRDIMQGFDLKLTYDWYGPDYEYNHVWRFHEDGQFGSAIVIQGPGEESLGLHTYHLPFRFDLNVSASGGDSFQRLANGRWTDVAKEGRHKSGEAPRFEWRLIDKTHSRSVEARARKGDNAEIWALQYKTRESWAAWGSAGRGVPGSPKSVPAIYAGGQSVQNTNVVIWYIAHVSAVDRVSACGPWFSLNGYPRPPRKGGHPIGPM